MQAMVIDDSKAMRMILTRMLEELGHDVAHAAAYSAMTWARVSWLAT